MRSRPSVVSDPDRRPVLATTATVAAAARRPRLAWARAGIVAVALACATRSGHAATLAPAPPAPGAGAETAVSTAPAPAPQGLGTGPSLPRDFGVAIMGGPGMTRFGGRQRHDLALVVGQVGWTVGSMRHGVVRPGPWRVALEASAGGQTRPLPRDFFGLTPVVRYEWSRRGPWHPFVAAGVGASYTNIRQPDLSTRFQFNDQFGVGMRRDLSPFASLVFECRWIHLSNAGLDMPNNGTNTLAFRIGYRRTRPESAAAPPATDRDATWDPPPAPAP